MVPAGTKRSDRGLKISVDFRYSPLYPPRISTRRSGRRVAECPARLAHLTDGSDVVVARVKHFVAARGGTPAGHTAGDEDAVSSRCGRGRCRPRKMQSSHEADVILRSTGGRLSALNDRQRERRQGEQDDPVRCDVRRSIHCARPRRR